MQKTKKKNFKTVTIQKEMKHLGIETDDGNKPSELLINKINNKIFFYRNVAQ